MSRQEWKNSSATLCQISFLCKLYYNIKSYCVFSSMYLKQVLLESVQYLNFRLCIQISNKGHCEFLEYWNSQKVLPAFDNVFHVYLMRGLKKNAKKKIVSVAFWDNPIYLIFNPDGQDRGLIFLGENVDFL